MCLAQNRTSKIYTRENLKLLSRRSVTLEWKGQSANGIIKDDELLQVETEEGKKERLSTCHTIYLDSVTNKIFFFQVLIQIKIKLLELRLY